MEQVFHTDSRKRYDSTVRYFSLILREYCLQELQAGAEYGKHLRGTEMVSSEELVQAVLSIPTVFAPGEMKFNVMQRQVKAAKYFISRVDRVPRTNYPVIHYARELATKGWTQQNAVNYRPMLNTLWQTVGIVFADRPADMQEALDWFNPRGAIKELERRSQPVAPAASTDHWGAWMEYEDV